MTTMSRTLKAALGIATLVAASTSLANAQCVSMGAFGRGASLLRQPSWSGEISQAAFSPATTAGPEASQAAPQEPIVGFWKVTFLSKGNAGVPDGTVIDEGYSEWHSDGTEILNSSRPPATGSFCLGVWEKTGQSTYKLNHFAISWKPDGTLFGPARVQETVTVSRDHESFEGTFTIDQYDQHGTLQVHRAGRIQGKRITVTTPISGALLD